MTSDEWDKLFGISGMLKVVGSNPTDGMRGSTPFAVGDKMQTMGDENNPPIELECVKISCAIPGQECSLWSDGIWRYNRDHDRGRVTGRAWDWHANIIPEYPKDFVRK